MPPAPPRRSQPDAHTTPKDLHNPDDNLKIPGHEGEPPRPATEPRHAKGSSRTPKTATDPATGEPTR